MSGQEGTTDNRRTIWQELEGWARDLAPWQRYVLAQAIRSGRLGDEQLSHAYSIFLRDSGLAQSATAEPPSSMSGRPESIAHEPILLKCVGPLQAVNALPDTAALNFAAGLTVVYGRNGAGKSGFARVLSNACFCRKPPPILPDVLSGNEPPKEMSAQIIISKGSQADEPITFKIGLEHEALKRIAVFDSAIANSRLTEDSPLGFKPAGFDVFPEMARVFGLLQQRLNNEIAARSRENLFVKSFLAPETDVSKFVATLSAQTDREELGRLATFGEGERARLDEIGRQIEDLKSKSVAEATQNLRSARDAIALLDKTLLGCATHLGNERRVSYRTLHKEFQEQTKLLAERGAESFQKSFFTKVGSPEWETFIASARALGYSEDPNYPRESDHCLLCHRPLDSPSHDLIHRFWGFLDSDLRKQVERLGGEISTVIGELRDLDLGLFADGTTARASVVKVAPTIVSFIDQTIGLLTDEREEIITALTGGPDPIGPCRVRDFSEPLAIATAQIDKDILRLQEQDAGEVIQALEDERVYLRHREVLAGLHEEIGKYVADLQWAASAMSLRGSLSPRPVTDKGTELFSVVIVDAYREALAAECISLDCELPVEFRTRGSRGETVRSLRIGGDYNPKDVLSEGEQRAVALADFLTEVSLNPSAAGIVLDDPVTSQDLERKKRIAHRLVQEARRRQVIIFTHDLVFLTMIADSASDEGVDILTHWIERDAQGRPGQISLNDCPANTPQYRNTNKAKATLAEAQTAVGSEREKLIRRGMGELRRTVEEIVPQFLMKEVVKRWSDRVMVTSLNKINWDNALADEIIAVYGDASAIFEGHSHTEEGGKEPPEPKDLDVMIARVESLIKRSKAQRA